MNKVRTALLALPLLFALAACNNKQPEPTLGSNSKDSFNDALDRRPHEKTRDAAEDIGDSMKRSGGEIKDAIKDETKSK